MNQLERDELVVLLSDTRNEEERGIAAIDDLRVCCGGHISEKEWEWKGKKGKGERTLVLQEVAHPRSPGKDELSDVLDDLGCKVGEKTKKEREKEEKGEEGSVSLVTNDSSTHLQIHNSARPIVALLPPLRTCPSLRFSRCCSFPPCGLPLRSTSFPLFHHSTSPLCLPDPACASSPV